MEMGQAGQGLSSKLLPQEDSGLQRRLALSSPPSLSLPLTLCSTKPSSPNPSILAPQPHPASFPRFKLNHHYQLTTSIAQRTASVSAWDSLPPALPPPPSPSLQRAQGVDTCSSRHIPAQSKVSPAPLCSCSAPYPVIPPPFRLPVALPPPNDDDGLGL